MYKELNTEIENGVEVLLKDMINVVVQKYTQQEQLN